ncbi:MAG: hypothetical protein ACRCTY_07915, partial [Candidatus Adiutrix sp.]
MDEQTLLILEYEVTLNLLVAETHSDVGAQAAALLSPTLSPDEILKAWDEIEQAQMAMAHGVFPDFSGHLDLTNLWERLTVEGAMLNTVELEAVAQEARTISQVRSLLLNLGEVTPLLLEMATLLTPQNDLAEIISRTIGPEGEILDSASPELARLRMEQGTTRQGLTQKLTSLMRSESFCHIIQDEVITTRSGRYVVPVRSSAPKMGGLVHDWSKTGSTAFLEPLEAVADNNKLSLLKRKEKAEIERILQKISHLVHLAAPDFTLSGSILTRLDLIMAKGRLARNWKAHRPDYVPGGGFNLKQAQHPLLAGRLAQSGGHMTPLDLQISPANPVVIIS